MQLPSGPPLNVLLAKPLHRYLLRHQAPQRPWPHHLLPQWTCPPPSPTAVIRSRDFLGEGGKKRVFLAHDGLLDRDIAFALIKTERLDDASRSHITREVLPITRELGTQPLTERILAAGDIAGLIVQYLLMDERLRYL